VAVASATSGDSLSFEFVLAADDATATADATAADAAPSADPAASVHLVGEVDATGTGDFEAATINFTALRAAALSDSTGATPGSGLASAARAASPVASSAVAAGPAAGIGQKDGSPDADGTGLDSAPTTAPAERGRSAMREADDALTGFGLLFLTAPTDRAEALPGSIAAVEAALPGVPEANPDGRQAVSIGAVEFLGESPRPAESAPDDAGAGARAVPPQSGALRSPAEADLVWSGLELRLLDGDLDPMALRRESSPAPLPGAAEPADVRVSLLRVGTFLAQAFYLQKLQSAGAGADAGTAGLAAGAADQLRAAEVVQEYAAELSRLVRGFYERFLGRAALNGEEQGWVNMLLGGQTEENVLSAFLSTEEFGRRAAAMAGSLTPDEAFIQGLYALLLLRVATDEEITGWLTALPTLGRRGVAHSLLRSLEYRKREIEAYFRELLHREGEAQEVADWAATPFDLRRIRELFVPHPERLALE
jgi:hypothetical protein